MKKITSLILLLIGTAILILAVVFLLDTKLPSELISIKQLIITLLGFVLGIGASVMGWMDLFKKDKSSNKSKETSINVAGNSVFGESKITVHSDSTKISDNKVIGDNEIIIRQEEDLVGSGGEAIGRERPKVKIAYPLYLTHEQWRNLDVFVYLESFENLVLGEIKQLRVKDGDDYDGARLQLPKSLPKGCSILVTISSEEIQVNPSEVEFKWLEAYFKIPFRIAPSEKSSVGNASIEVEIYGDDLPLGSLSLSIYITDKNSPSERSDVSSLQLYENVFASYAREDLEKALHLKKRYMALGVKLFVDREDLMTGDDWQKTIFETIDTSDLFQLFWSTNSQSSRYVKLEWEHALNLLPLKGSRFIRPIYWEEQKPDIPSRLSRINFRYLDLDWSD